MSSQRIIDHEGIVENMEGDTARVKIFSQSACASCHAKGACTASDQEDKYLEVPTHGISFKAGESVRVEVSRNLGFKAVVVGYIFPFILVVLVLAVCTAAGFKETTAGILSLFSLVPYYLVLYLARKKIEKTFTFNIKKP